MASSHGDGSQNSRREAGRGWGSGQPKEPSARRMVRGVRVVHRDRLRYLVRIVGHIRTAALVVAHSHRDRSLEYSWRANNHQAAASPRVVSVLSLNSSE